jgi:hypothetical protein
MKTTMHNGWARRVSLALLAALLLAGTAGAAVPTDYLHYWHPSRATNSVDYGPGGKNGTISGSVTVGTNGWLFNPSGSGTGYISLPGPITNTTSYSFSFWAKPDKTAMDARLYGGWVISDRLAGSPADWQFVYDKASGKWGGSYWNTANTIGSYSGSAAVHDVWTHVAVTVTGNQVVVYADGVAVTNAAGHGTPNDAYTGNAMIGNASWGAGADLQYRGYLDNLKFYQRVLSAAEISSLYDAGRLYTYADPNLPVVANGAATGITASSAALSGTLTTNGTSPATVYLFCATNDCTTNEASWIAAGAVVTNFGPYSSGAAFTNTLSGLSSNTTYYWNHMASNASGKAWAATAGSTSFRTYGSPAVNNGAGATNVRVTVATLNGNLDNGAPADVYVYYWLTGSGPSNMLSFGSRGLGAFSTNVSGLLASTAYSYQCFASNAYGMVWAPAASNFTTPASVLVTVSGSETWDGTANPHAADGVVLTTNGITYTYTIPNGMTIASNGSVTMGSSASNFVFAFTGGNLQIDPGGLFNIGLSGTRSGAIPLTLNLGGYSIVGGGNMTNGYASSPNGTRALTITNVADITLRAIDMSVQDCSRGTLTIRATGTVNVGLLGNYDVNSGGSSAGNIDVRAEAIVVSNVYTYAARVNSTFATSGDVILSALGAPGYDVGATAANDHNNALTVTGVIRTRGGWPSSTQGSVTLRAVNVTFGPGFTNDVPANRTFTLLTGYGGTEHFTNNSAASVGAVYVVSHVEHPNPAIIVTTVEPWDGTQNPRAADGVTLTTNASAYVYTIPKAMQIVYGGRIDVGADVTRNFEFRFTGGNLQIDNGGMFDIGVNGVRFPTARLLTIDMGGSNIVTNAAAGAGDIKNAFPDGTSEYGGSRSLLITNVTDVTLGTLSARANDAGRGTVTVVAGGKVTILTLLENSDTSTGGGSGANIVIRAAAIDVLNADTAAYRTSGQQNGNILLEALKPPQYDPTQPINTRSNSLTLRGTLKTKQAGTSNTGGSVTNRAALLTLGPSFVGLIGAVSTNFAGDGYPRETYFVNNCTNTAASVNFSFAANHNVQLGEATPTIRNLPPATNQTATSADVVGQLLTNGASAATVYLFCATNDCSTNEAAWAAAGALVTNFGPYSSGAVFTNTLGGLSNFTVYYWNHMASNAAGKSWAALTSPSFQTLPGSSPLPIIVNSGSNGFASTSFNAIGQLVTNGASPATVYLFCATNDCTTNEASWRSAAGVIVTNFGPYSSGALFTNALAGLTPKTTYYWNYMASNDAGKVWGAPSASPLVRTYGTAAVSGSETWDGTANPHAADGVTLAVNGTTNTYTMPYGMTISAGGSVNLGASGNGFVFAFTGGNLQIDPGGLFNIGRAAEGSYSPLTLDLGGYSITGGGIVTNKETLGTRTLTITNVADITLSAINMSVADDARGALTIRATGTVNVGLLGNYDWNSGGSSAGDIDVRAEVIVVSNVYSYAERVNNALNTSGDIILTALGAPGYDVGVTAANDHNNALTVNGVIRTRGGWPSSTRGSVTLRAVNVTFGPGFTNDVPTNRTFTLLTGYGGTEHLANNSAATVAPHYVVTHVEHPNPTIIVGTTEAWNGAANPHATEGVALTTNASAYVYTIPKPMEIVYGGSVDVGADYSRNFEFRFTGGNLQVDSGGMFDIGVNGVRTPTARTLTLDLGGSNIVADAVGGAGDIRNAGADSGQEASRTLLITNVTDVTLGTLSARANDAGRGTLTVVAGGKVTVQMLENSDTSQGGSGANITVRAAQIDVRDVNASAARTSVVVANGNILLEALKPPEYDPTQRINLKENTLILRGTLTTKGGRSDHTGGSVTNRAAVLTLGPSFVGLINTVSTNFAGDAFPREKYFINNCTNMGASVNFSFSANHNVQLKSDAGTVFTFR